VLLPSYIGASMPPIWVDYGTISSGRYPFENSNDVDLSTLAGLFYVGGRPLFLPGHHSLLRAHYHLGGILNMFGSLGGLAGDSNFWGGTTTLFPRSSSIIGGHYHLGGILKNI